jgi:hypothetical protein
LRALHDCFAFCEGEAPLQTVWRLGRQDVCEYFRNEIRIPASDEEKPL